MKWASINSTRATASRTRLTTLWPRRRDEMVKQIEPKDQHKAVPKAANSPKKLLTLYYYSVPRMIMAKAARIMPATFRLLIFSSRTKYDKRAVMIKLS